MRPSYYCYQKKKIFFLFCSQILGSRIQTEPQNEVLPPSHDVWDLRVEDLNAGVASGTGWNPMEGSSLTCLEPGLAVSRVPGHGPQHIHVTSPCGLSSSTA